MGALGAFAPVLLQERGHCPHTKYKSEKKKTMQEQVREKTFP